MAIETILTGIVLALAKKGAEKLVDKSAEHAFENRSAIMDKVKGLLVGEELTMLKLLEEEPTNDFLQGKVKAALKPKLEENPETAKELEKLVQPFLDIQNKKNTMTQTGDNNIGVQDVSNSDIKINQK